MARRGVLGGGTTSPFDGGGTDFGAFNILNPGNEAYLAFVKVETAWNAGQATNDTYLAALKVYADAQDAGSSDYINAQARLVSTTYQVARNVLLSRIDARTATVADLVAFDKSKLVGLTPDSEEYQQRLGLYQASQARLIGDEEKKKVDLYQAGKLTTTALQAWYQGVLDGPVVDQNPDLTDSLKGRVAELVTRVQDEKDSRMLSDFNDGKVTTHDFLAYATAAKGRYAAGTTQALEWAGRIADATTNASETALLYRYNLSQQYAQLAEFVKGNGKGAGGTSSSTSTRIVLGADGQWKTVTSTTTKATAPSASEVAAHAKLQIEIADARRQMAQIAAKVSSVGGFVQSNSILKFYTGKLGKLARGSAEWYAVQGKIDNVNDRIHQEQVTAKEGIRITYPGGGAVASGGGGGGGGGGGATGSSSPRPTGAGGGGYSLTAFMRAIATQESGGRYDARNASTGAYGKYQILPSNWSSWAQRAGLAANAPQTPQNQEKVAAAAFGRLAKSYNNDWSRVAAAWFGGVAGELNRGPRTQAYVDAIMSHMGTTRAAVSAGAAGGGGGTTGAGSYSAAAGGPGRAPSAAAPHPAGHPTSTGSGPLGVITSVGVGGRKTQTEIVTTHSQGFPTNLDGRAFEKFYANYENAFESGAESFVDTSSGKAVAYFIGSDPASRIDRMRHLDDLRVSLFDTRAVAYAGTASELTAINARNNAYQDVARHEYEIVDTASKTASGSAKVNALTNPLAAGIRVLDTTTAAVKSNLAMAAAAYARGDLSGAYALYQMAQELTSVNGAKMQLLAGYVSASDARIAAIARTSGGIGVDEALGASKGDAFTKDLARLHSFDTELTTLFNDATLNGKPAITELKSHLALDAAGNVQYDSTPGDPQGKLVLTPDTFFLLKPNGQVSVESRPPVYNGNTGKTDFTDAKTVTVKVKSGNDVIDAQAPFTVGQVGSFIDPNDPGHLLPIMGKVVQTQDPTTGKWQNFYENPLAPGSAQGWSASPWVFQTPSGFKATPDGKGGATYSYKGSQDYTYTFVFDGASGTYQLTRSRDGGFLNSPVVDEFVGSAGDSSFGAETTAAGFNRSGGSGGFDGTDQPVFGFSDAAAYATWQRSFQAPALANLGKTISAGHQSPAQIQARRIVLPTPDERFAAAVDPTQAPTDRHVLPTIDERASGGQTADFNARTVPRPVLPMTGTANNAGKLADDLARAGLPPVRAGLPPTADPEWVAAQRRLTAPTVAAPSPSAAAKRTAPPPKLKPRRPPVRAPLPKPVAPPPVVGTGHRSQAL